MKPWESRSICKDFVSIWNLLLQQQLQQQQLSFGVVAKDDGVRSEIQLALVRRPGTYREDTFEKAGEFSGLSFYFFVWFQVLRVNDVVP